MLATRRQPNILPVCVRSSLFGWSLVFSELPDFVVVLQNIQYKVLRIFGLEINGNSLVSIPLCSMVVECIPDDKLRPRRPQHYDGYTLVKGML